MNYMPQKAALISFNDNDAEFAENALASAGFQVTRFPDSQSLVDVIQRQLAGEVINGDSAPSFAVLAGNLPQLAQLSDTSRLQDAAPHVPVVATGSMGGVPEAVEIMRQGATDVVALPCSNEELSQHIRTAVKAAEEKARKAMRKAELRSRLAELTPAEREVLDAILDGKSNKQVAQMLSIGLRTVELRRSKIMRKMKADTVAQLVRWVCLAGGCEEKEEAT